MASGRLPCRVSLSPFCHPSPPFFLRVATAGLPPNEQGTPETAEYQGVQTLGQSVVRRHAVWQFKKLSEPTFMSDSEAFDIGPGIRPADCASKRDSDHVHQQVVSSSLFSRVCQIDKVCQKFKASVLHNNRDSVRVTKNRAISNCPLSGTLFTQKSGRSNEADMRLPCPPWFHWY